MKEQEQEQEPLSVFFIRALGFIPLALGLLVVALGCLYEYLDYRFGGAIRIWSFMWGLSGIGVGLVMCGTSKRRFAFAGVLSCALSFWLIAYWHFRVSPAADWFWRLTVLNALGACYGAVAIVVKTVSKLRGSREPPGKL